MNIIRMIKIEIYSDASHFDIEKFTTYAFVIKWDNILHKESWRIDVNVKSSTAAEYKWVWRAIDYMFDNWIYFDSIDIYCDNIWLTIDKNKFNTDNLLNYIKKLRYKVNRLKRLVNESHWKKIRRVHFKYSQARKGINDAYWYQEWCDKNCRRQGSFKIKKNEIKDFINQWYNACIPIKIDYKEAINNFYTRNKLNNESPI